MTGNINEFANQDQSFPYQQSSRLNVRSHPKKEQVARQIDTYFGDKWPFKSSEELEKVRKYDLTGMTCYAFPTVQDDRIFILVLYFIIFVLVDDMLDDMSFNEGEIFIKRLMSISWQEKEIDINVPIEYLLSDMWKQIRDIDTETAIQLMQETFLVWEKQIMKDRNKWNDFSAYLDYRVHDGGGLLAQSMLRFGMGMSLATCHEKAIYQLDVNAAKILGVMNDIHSFKKETSKCQNSRAEIASLCSSVDIVSREWEVTTGTAKLILLAICRDWEQKHEKLSEEIISRSPGLLNYCTAVSYLIAGNEAWSKKTSRYT